LAKSLGGPKRGSETTGWIIDGTHGAAKILALHPNTLRSRMKKLGIVRALHKRQP
jgi:hypothetical protein